MKKKIFAGVMSLSLMVLSVFMLAACGEPNILQYKEANVQSSQIQFIVSRAEEVTNIEITAVDEDGDLYLKDTSSATLPANEAGGFNFKYIDYSTLAFDGSAEDQAKKAELDAAGVKIPEGTTLTFTYKCENLDGKEYSVSWDYTIPQYAE